MAVYIGEVIDVNDEFGGERIKVRLLPQDKYKEVKDIPYSFPLLPKMLRVKPKVGEASLIICADDDNQNSQRYYIAPLISQPQFLDKDNYQFGATTLLNHSLRRPVKGIDYDTEARGVVAKGDEVAIYSRGDSDIILSSDDIRIRCGARLVNPYASPDNKLSFNRVNPSYIKLKYHENGLENKLQPSTPSYSTTTLVADEINLISNKSVDPLLGGNELYDRNEQITDEDMQKIINEAHVLPYGDVLVDFLMAFLQMFKSHTHKYANLPPCPDAFSEALDSKYGRCGRKVETDDNLQLTNREIEMVSNTFRGLYDKLLSKNVRIN